MTITQKNKNSRKPDAPQDDVLEMWADLNFRKYNLPLPDVVKVAKELFKAKEEDWKFASDDEFVDVLDTILRHMAVEGVTSTDVVKRIEQRKFKTCFETQGALEILKVRVDLLNDLPTRRKDTNRELEELNKIGIAAYVKTQALHTLEHLAHGQKGDPLVVSPELGFFANVFKLRIELLKMYLEVTKPNHEASMQEIKGRFFASINDCLRSGDLSTLFILEDIGTPVVGFSSMISPILGLEVYFSQKRKLSRLRELLSPWLAQSEISVFKKLTLKSYFLVPNGPCQDIEEAAKILFEILKEEPDIDRWISEITDRSILNKNTAVKQLQEFAALQRKLLIERQTLPSKLIKNVISNQTDDDETDYDEIPNDDHLTIEGLTFSSGNQILKIGNGVDLKFTGRTHIVVNLFVDRYRANGDLSISYDDILNELREKGYRTKEVKDAFTSSKLVHEAWMTIFKTRLDRDGKDQKSFLRMETYPDFKEVLAARDKQSAKKNRISKK